MGHREWIYIVVIFFTFMRVKRIIKYRTLILEVSVPPLKSLFVEYVFGISKY